jgi:hypothetical protein
MQVQGKFLWLAASILEWRTKTECIMCDMQAGSVPLMMPPGLLPSQQAAAGPLQSQLMAPLVPGMMGTAQGMAQQQVRCAGACC